MIIMKSMGFWVKELLLQTVHDTQNWSGQWQVLAPPDCPTYHIAVLYDSSWAPTKQKRAYILDLNN